MKTVTQLIRGHLDQGKNAMHYLNHLEQIDLVVAYQREANEWGEVLLEDKDLLTAMSNDDPCEVGKILIKKCLAYNWDYFNSAFSITENVFEYAVEPSALR